MGAHAVLGPSGAHRWMMCAGSVALESGLPNRSSEAADEGTAYHFLSAHCIETSSDAKEFIDKTIAIVDGDALFDVDTNVAPLRKIVVDAENAAYCQEYIDYVRTISAGNLLWLETSLPIEQWTEEDGAKGTADAIVVNQAQRELVVVDLKFGRGVEVSAENNKQLLIYALAALALVSLSHDIDTVRLVIHQPRSGDGKPQEWLIPVDDLLAFGEKVKRAAGGVWAALELFNDIKAAGTPADVYRAWWEANLLPDTETCRWCNAKACCPALGNAVEKATLLDFQDLTQTELPPVKHADNTELAMRANKADLVELWLKAVRSEVESELLSGNAVPGWKLVRAKRGNRKWSDEALVEAQLKKYRFTYEQKYDMKLKSPPAFEKMLKKDQPKKWETLEPFVRQADGGLSVAPESDKRPAESIAPDASDMPDLDVDASELL
jgi:Protein of unknown function (DUF2800)